MAPQRPAQHSMEPVTHPSAHPPIATPNQAATQAPGPPSTQQPPQASSRPSPHQPTVTQNRTTTQTPAQPPTPLRPQVLPSTWQLARQIAQMNAQQQAQQIAQLSAEQRVQLGALFAQRPAQQLAQFFRQPSVNTSNATPDQAVASAPTQIVRQPPLQPPLQPPIQSSMQSPVHPSMQQNAQHRAQQLSQLIAQQLAQLNAPQFAQLTAPQRSQLITWQNTHLDTLLAQQMVQQIAQLNTQLDGPQLAQLTAQQRAQLTTQRLHQLIIELTVQQRGQLTALRRQQSTLQTVQQTAQQPSQAPTLQNVQQTAQQPPQAPTLQPAQNPPQLPAQISTMPPRLPTRPPTILTRRYISLQSSEPTETTTSLILTSPLGVYVDIRILDPVRTREPGTLPGLPLPGVLPLPQFKGSLTRAEDIPYHMEKCGIKWHTETVLGMERLARANAGMSQNRTFDGKPQTVWLLWLANNYLDCRDKHYAAFKALETERGEDGEEHKWERRTWSPKPTIFNGGKPCDAEEGWLYLPAVLDQSPKDCRTITEKVYGTRVGRVQPNPKPTPADRLCVVLVAIREPSALTPSGVVIRAGDWCQGILRTSATGFRAERWMNKGKSWTCLVKVDSEEKTQRKRELHDVVFWLFYGQVSMGMEKVVNGITWRVKEVVYWW